MSKRKYEIGYEYENKYGKFQITNIEERWGRHVYVVVCQKCGHTMIKKASEISAVRKCLGCVRNMEYSLYNIGDVVNGLEIIAKTPTLSTSGYVQKEYLCKCIVDGKTVQIRESHLHNGVGCMECAAKKRGVEQRKLHDEYMTEINVKNPFIDIVGTYIDQYTKIKYICKICRYDGEALPNNLLRGGGCPVCNMSTGEKRIAKYLENNNIKYEIQYTFDECRNVLSLPFDFYLTDYKICIEYDGEQHFKPIDFFGGEEKFKKQQYNDMLKTQYCIDNNIYLCRINYNQDIENELNLLISGL